MPKFELPPLPWAPDALEPLISRATIDKHYGKHHKAYVDKTNSLIEGTHYADMTLEEIILESAQDANAKTLFNNAAQVWNHSRYWESLSPDGGAPSSALDMRIKQDFGSLSALRDELVKKGVGHFASGWVWLAAENGALKVIDTHDADNALVHGLDLILVLDLWEHAYYLDYQNERERHLRAIVEGRLDWRRASDRFAAIAG